MILCRFHADNFNPGRWRKLAENLFQAFPDFVVVEGFAPVLDDKNDMVMKTVDCVSAAV